MDERRWMGMIAVHDIDEIYRTAVRTLGAGLLSVLCSGVGGAIGIA